MKRKDIEQLTKFFSIFPVQEKVPFKGFKWKDRHTKDTAETAKLFKGYNGCNVAIATGPVSGIFVLDIDIKKEEKGDESLKCLIEKNGELPTTVKAMTWSGGWHYYFKYPKDRKICNRAGLLQGIDIRGDNGYVVAPPSVIDGKPYTWVYSPFETEIAEAPQWLLDLLDKKKSTKVDLSSPGEKIIANRNDALHKIAAGFRRFGIDAEQILPLTQAINKTRCEPPLPDSEVRKLVVSALKYEIGAVSTGPYTDIWNAAFFAEHYGEDVLYCEKLGGWFYWDGARWHADDRRNVYRLAKKATSLMMKLSKGDKDLYKHAIKSSSEGKLKAMVSLSRDNDLMINAEKFDADNFLFNCLNGSIDLMSGELKPHDRMMRVTKLAPVNYNPEAKCPRWLQFLDEIFIGDVDLIDYIQRAIGYSLSGSMVEQCFFILWGTGNNGKSTLLKHIFKILGDYSMGTAASTLMEKNNDSQTNDIAVLKGARFITAAESGQHRALSEALIKQLTGDDPITARLLYHENFTFFATFKIFLATNHMPKIKGTDDGIKRRMVLVPFNYKVPPEKLKENLDAKLEDEKEGILAWAVEGFRKWTERKLSVDVPQKIVDTRSSYFRNQDTIGQFLEENCVFSKYNRCTVKEVFDELSHWLFSNNFKKCSRNDFIDYMQSNRGLQKVRFTSEPMKHKMGFHGIGLKSMEDTSFLGKRDWNEYTQ